MFSRFSDYEILCPLRAEILSFCCYNCMILLLIQAVFRLNAIAILATVFDEKWPFILRFGAQIGAQSVLYLLSFGVQKLVRKVGVGVSQFA